MVTEKKRVDITITEILKYYTFNILGLYIDWKSKYVSNVILIYLQEVQMRFQTLLLSQVHNQRRTTTTETADTRLRV